MAIAFDAASNSGAQTTATTYNWNHTCTGSNLMLIVAINQRTTAGNVVTSVTYNGVKLNLTVAANNGSRRSDIWYLANPATGTHSIAVTLSAAPTVSSAEAVSLTGVSRLDAINTASGTSTTPSVAVTTIADNCWVIDSVEGGIAGNTALTAGGSQAHSTAIDQTGGFFGGISTQGPKTPAGSVTMSWTFTSSSIWSHVAVSVKPYASSEINLLPGTVTTIIGPTTTSAAVDTTGASLLVLAVSKASAVASGASISDSQGNTWHAGTDVTNGAVNSCIWYAYDKSGGALSTSAAHTFTIGSPSTSGAVCAAFSGSLTSSTPLDQQNINTAASSTTATTGSVTPGQNNELLITAIGAQVASTAPFSIDNVYNMNEYIPGVAGNVQCIGMAYAVQTTLAASNPTFTVTTASNLTAAIASFKQAVAVTNTFIGAMCEQFCDALSEFGGRN